MGWRIRIREDEGCEDQPFLAWDHVLTRFSEYEYGFDWALADSDETRNQGGLRAKAAIHTAVIIQLFTDRRALEDMELPDDGPDRRGWWGDSVDVRDDLFETELGSWLWTLRRSIINQDVLDRAQEYTEMALEPLIAQGVFARIDVTTRQGNITTNTPETGVLIIEVDGYGQDGLNIYNQKFDVLWSQIRMAA